MAKDTKPKKKSEEPMHWEARELSVQDYKNIAYLFLGGRYRPEYILMMNNGSRRMRPVIALAIDSYCKESINPKLEYQMALQEAINTLDERMTEAGRSWMAEQLDGGNEELAEILQEAV
jgi:hypothetical protein